MSKNSSMFKSNDPQKCNHAMGIRSFRDPVSKLRWCQRDKDTCPYHSRKR